MAFTQELLGRATELGTAGTGAGNDSGFAMNGSWSFGRPSNCPPIVVAGCISPSEA